jgi:hypothetical protein
MFTTITFSIEELPNGQLTGKARAGSWPGDLDVIDLQVTDGKISFTGIGHRPWGAGPNALLLPNCCTKLVFEGLLRDDQIDIVLTWPQQDGGPGGPPLPMRAERVNP